MQNLCIYFKIIVMFSEELKRKQNFVADFFAGVLQKNKLVNAYFLLGDAQRDKLDFARELTKILNCKENHGEYKEPCGKCMNCKWIDTATHPMTPIYLEPKAESKKQIITIDAIKTLQTELAKTSEYYRVVIIPDASYMVLNKHSANALLKVLEEPNQNILFLLFAKDADLALPTIISRTQQLGFNANPANEYSEEAQALFDEHANSLFAHSRLEAMTIAENLANSETRILLEFLEMMQDKYTAELQEGASLQLAKQIELVEEAKHALRSFVRPKNALEQMLARTLELVTA